MDAADWDARYAGRELIWTAEPNRFLVEQVGDMTPGTALDIACGEGRNAVWLAGRGHRVTAIDFSPVAITKAKALAEVNRVEVDWVIGDVTAVLPAGRFDLVALVYLHVPADEAFDLIDRAAAALASAGTLLIVGHHVDNLRDGHGGPRDPALLHDHRAIAGRLAANGAMSVVTAARVERPVPDAGPDVVALDSLVRATRIALD